MMVCPALTGPSLRELVTEVWTSTYLVIFLARCIRNQRLIHLDPDLCSFDPDLQI